MNSLIIGSPTWLLPGDPFATATRSTAAIDAAASAQLPEYAAWILAGTVLVIVAITWLLLRRAAAAAAAAGATNGRLQAKLDKATGQINDFADSQARFVGNLALEIKAPLATVLVHADLLLASSNDAATARLHAQSVAQDIRHLSDLVESFLRLARPFAQEDTSHHVPVHFHDLVIEAVQSCQSLATTRGVSIVPMLAEPGQDAPVEVFGDPAMLEAMIANLVRNAVLSAPRGTRVDVREKLRNEAVLLSVRDHGLRVDDDHLDSMFDGFLRVPTPPRSSAGTGLSLAIAKRVAEHHRGTISLRNVSEGGCEFEIQLPRWRPEDPLGAPAIQQAVPQQPARG